MNKCSGCSRDFTSVTAFDKHRTGHFVRNGRRCKTEQEMLEQGLEQKTTGKWGLIASGSLFTFITEKRLYRIAV